MPGTENSESNADKDAQKQLWNDKKVLMGEGRATRCTRVMIQDLQLIITFSPQDDASKPNTCDVPGIK